MNFDSKTPDLDAPAVVPDPSFARARTDVNVQALAVCHSFESAPDEGGGGEGTAKRFASNFADGHQAECRFHTAAEAQGWTVVQTSAFDDKVRRIDAAYAVPGVGILLVDIKAAKKLSRSDASPQFRFHWLELHETGSLFSGESRVLALEVGPGSFALFNKSELREWIRSRVKGPAVARSTQALFRPYQRDGKLREWITLVDVAEMQKLCKGVL
jgi:hypothetical protein